MANEGGSEMKEVARATGHRPPGGVPKVVSPEEVALENTIRIHQAMAAKLTNAEEVRNLVQYSTGYGVLSTNSKKFEGYPGASVVGFGLDGTGRFLFALSSLSAHTGELLSNPRMSITVTSASYKGAADARVNMIGDVHKVSDEERASVREMYKAKHPDAFWVDFDDFSFMRMDTIKAIRYVGGFGIARNIDPEDAPDT